ncbi:hypothetical protein C8A01DRAFT_20287 [Parachaetomium inaequale]|uniref:Uncharacterized protein n=1 Tax=Parachaetomium inaequale TaxID=2588326 RepID=A0AAN6SM36_9PEZI|nr:hypothetical protein C8A01DRAFT_20287 [Parachaetomium inaequale]
MIPIPKLLDLNLPTLVSHWQEDEDQLLNNIWIGLLSVEALMVLGVALRGLVGAVASSRLFGPQQQRRAELPFCE